MILAKVWPCTDVLRRHVVIPLSLRQFGNIQPLTRVKIKPAALDLKLRHIDSVTLREIDRVSNNSQDVIHSIRAIANYNHSRGNSCIPLCEGYIIRLTYPCPSHQGKNDLSCEESCRDCFENARSFELSFPTKTQDTVSSTHPHFMVHTMDFNYCTIHIGNAQHLRTLPNER